MSAEQRNGRLKQILLVEDDDDVRRSLTMLLRSWGYSVDVYRSGKELLSTRSVPTPDCMIVDYKMPQIDGLDLLSRLKSLGLVAPALLITGFYSNSLESRARAIGYSQVIEKPAMHVVLQNALQESLATA